MAGYWTLPRRVGDWVASLAAVLHGQSAWRLAPLLVGLLFASGRRTVSSWLRGNALSDDYQDYYYFLGSLGRKIKEVAQALMGLLVAEIPLGDRLVFAIDDTPTKRAGPKVQGAGIHHNPTPGPTGSAFLYGHVWVTLALVVQHPLWGSVELPVWASLYVTEKGLAKLPAQLGWKFATKLELAAAQIRWLAENLSHLDKPLWVVVDAFYGKAKVFQAAREASVRLVTRLRHDAALYEVPKPAQKKGRGRPRKYGSKISLAKRAGHPKGWQTETFRLYGEEVTKKYKTFEAISKTAGRMRVVLVKEETSWVAFVCSDVEATVAEILEVVADRMTIEQVFHDVKEVHGVGQPQLRYLWANIGSFNLVLWWHTLIEMWAWGQRKAKICDRASSPWDDANRRPSHADRRNALRRECIENELSLTHAAAAMSRKTMRFIKRLRKLVA